MRPDEELSSYVFRRDQIAKKTNTLHQSRLIPRRAELEDSKYLLSGPRR